MMNTEVVDWCRKSVVLLKVNSYTASVSGSYSHILPSPFATIQVLMLHLWPPWRFVHNTSLSSLSPLLSHGRSLLLGNGPDLDCGLTQSFSHYELWSQREPNRLLLIYQWRFCVSYFLKHKVTTFGHYPGRLLVVLTRLDRQDLKVSFFPREFRRLLDTKRS